MSLIKNGEELEQRFYDWLQSCRPLNLDNPKETPDETVNLGGKYNIFCYCWLSRGHRDMPFDFWIMTLPDPTELIYVDVVGFYEQGNTIRLNTRHKDWSKLLSYCKQHNQDINDNHTLPFKVTSFKAYLTYSPTSGYLADDWQFIRIRDRMPVGGLFMSEDRKKGLRSVESVFGKTETWVYDEEKKCKTAYGEEFTVNAMIRTKEHSEGVLKVVEHLKALKIPMEEEVKQSEEEVIKNFIDS